MDANEDITRELHDAGTALSDAESARDAAVARVRRAVESAALASVGTTRTLALLGVAGNPHARRTALAILRQTREKLSRGRGRA